MLLSALGAPYNLYNSYQMSTGDIIHGFDYLLYCVDQLFVVLFGVAGAYGAYTMGWLILKGCRTPKLSDVAPCKAEATPDYVECCNCSSDPDGWRLAAPKGPDMQRLALTIFFRVAAVFLLVQVVHLLTFWTWGSACWQAPMYEPTRTTPPAGGKLALCMNWPIEDNGNGGRDIQNNPCRGRSMYGINATSNWQAWTPNQRIKRLDESAKGCAIVWDSIVLVLALYQIIWLAYICIVMVSAKDLIGQRAVGDSNGADRDDKEMHGEGDVM